jgi:hypothetical protein
VADAPESQGVNIRNRFYTVTGRWASPTAVRTRLPGRRALVYVKNNRLHYTYNVVSSSSGGS